MVSLDQVRHVARLAKLELSPEEEERLVAQLSRILEYVDQLKELDEECDPGPGGVVPAEHRLRPDDPGPCLPREEVLALAPLADDGMFRVPAVLEGGGGA